jgi:hypothetical protein
MQTYTPESDASLTGMKILPSFKKRSNKFGNESCVEDLAKPFLFSFDTYGFSAGTRFGRASVNRVEIRSLEAMMQL